MKTLEDTKPSVVKQLKQSRLGRYLKDIELTQFADHGLLITYSNGENIIVEQEVDHNMFIILKGTVSVEIQGENRSVYLGSLGPGEVFGEAGVFVNTKRTASVVAKGNVKLFQFSRENFLKSINAHPKTGIKILFLIIYDLLGKLRSVNEELAYERKGDSGQEDIDAMIMEMIDNGIS